jgi:hypothetical protein
MGSVENLVKIVNLRCREATALISAAHDGKLRWRYRCALFLHLLICGPCRRYRRQLRKLARLLDAAVKRLEGKGQLPGVALSDEARRRLRELIEARPG